MPLKAALRPTPIPPRSPDKARRAFECDGTVMLKESGIFSLSVTVFYCFCIHAYGLLSLKAQSPRQREFCSLPQRHRSCFAWSSSFAGCDWVMYWYQGHRPALGRICVKRCPMCKHWTTFRHQRHQTEFISADIIVCVPSVWFKPNLWNLRDHIYG